MIWLMEFQSTPSAWRETRSRCNLQADVAFQSTPSAWRETLQMAGHCIHWTFQSTPSAWRETLNRFPEKYRNCVFQSTPSAWRETKVMDVVINYRRFQSTPSAWRETIVIIFIVTAGEISIHSLRMEGDPAFLICYTGAMHFNPLPPHGGRQIHPRKQKRH